MKMVGVETENQNISTDLNIREPTMTEQKQNKNEYQLVKLDLDLYPDAKCLDGSPGAFYIRIDPLKMRSKKWMFFLKGGGWCTDLEDCYERSKTDLGSTKSLKDDMGPYHGFAELYDDCDRNPTFCSFNKVFVWYCDGNSFISDNPDPVVHENSGDKLYFRGRDILRATMDTIYSGKVPSLMDDSSSMKFPKAPMLKTA